jgi:hypothetical protein
MSNPKRGSASLGFGDAAEHGLAAAGARLLGSPATKSTKNLFFWRVVYRRGYHVM